MVKVMSYEAQEKQWQKECDARTLADAEEIKAKPARLKGAQSAAKTMAKDAQVKAASLSKIAKTTAKTKTTAKPKAKAAPRTAPKKSSGTARVTSNTKTPYKRK